MKKFNEVMKAIMLFAAVFLAVACSSESQDEPQNENPEPQVTEAKTRVDIQLQENQKHIARILSNYKFSFTNDVISYVDNEAKDGKDYNFAVSPLSASMVISMLGNGLDNEGKRLYSQYLGIEDFDALNAINKILLDQLPEVDNSAKMSLANSIWINQNKNISMKKEYSDLFMDFYQAGTTILPFDTDALNAINQWGSDKTEGIIPEYLENLNAETYAILLNALYFQAPWKDEIFKTENTKDGIFHGIGNDVNVSMMKSKEFEGKYRTSDRFESITLYFGNGAFEFEIIAPKDNKYTSQLNEILSTEKFSEEFTNLEMRYIILTLPKFELESKLVINDVLDYANKGDLLSDLNFNMFEPTLNNLAVIYKQAASFSIDESGAKVASISSGEIYDGAPMPKPTLEITIDKPFLFFITEVSTGACVLSGRVAQL